MGGNTPMVEENCVLFFFFFPSVNKNFIEKMRKQEKNQIPWHTGCVQGKQMSTQNYINLQNLK